MARVSAILTACARLHNFIIQQDFQTDDYIDLFAIDAAEDDLEIQPHVNAPLGMSYIPGIFDEPFEAMEGISQVREATATFLWTEQIGRPTHNLKRKRQEIREVTSQNGNMNNKELMSPT